MAFDRPTINEIIDRGVTDIEGRTEAKQPLLPNSTLAIVSRANSGAAHLLHGHLEYNSMQILPSTAEKDSLDRHASLWGVKREGKKAASGAVIVTGTDGADILAGELLSIGALQYVVLSTVEISGGTVNVDVRATTNGADTNRAAGSILNFVNPIAGVDSQATVESSGLTGGYDGDSDEVLLSNLSSRIQQPPHGGADFDYIEFAKRVPGVTRVFPFPLNRGPGTVDVTFLRDGDANPIPNAAQIQDVQDSIDSARPVTAECIVFAPVEAPLNPVIQISPNTAAVQAAIEAELTDLIIRDAEPSGSLLLSRVREAVSTAAGESDNVVVSPSANVSYANNEVGVLGTVTFQNIP